MASQNDSFLSGLDWVKALGCTISSGGHFFGHGTGPLNLDSESIEEFPVDDEEQPNELSEYERDVLTRAYKILGARH